MSKEMSIIESFGDKDYIFKLNYKTMIIVQNEIDAGPLVILKSILNGTFKVEHISTILQWALVGGGLTANEALKLVKIYVQDMPINDNLELAMKIMSAAIYGREENSKSNEKS
ncbi:GTA-gp10 family protein [Bartonella tamiae]|uniref:Gene transfer agent family protein n=1 Tax=Bartonella tamiae Th239 TaxID=1094558 RepID=J0R7H0_9HYPH|nr:GTA-gp10 family protein [Bartonella tamiae]EJF91684.1 hypothetical protein ME5_00063 [Bartonella tamiae Th239]